jgi:hypothetical protein
MKNMDPSEKITPQNRVLVGEIKSGDQVGNVGTVGPSRQSLAAAAVSKQEERMRRAYAKAHQVSSRPLNESSGG